MIGHRVRVSCDPLEEALRTVAILQDELNRTNSELMQLTLELEQQAQQIRISEAKYRSLFAEMGQGFALHEMLFDVNGAPVDYVTLEVNQAFEELLEVQGKTVVGQLASRFLPPEELKGWVDLFSTIVRDGSAIHYEQASPANHKHLHGYAYALNRSQFAVLFEDITERKRAEEEVRLNLSLQQVRNQVLKMQTVADWEEVVRVLHHELSSLIELRCCRICLIDHQAGTYTCYNTSFAPEEWPLQSPEEHPLTPSLRMVMATGQACYRRTRAEVEHFQDDVGPEVRCIVDVPFLGGTLAVNSNRENAFGEHEIQILERFAQVVFEGYQRRSDLQQLAQTQQQLQQAQKMEAVGRLAAGVAHNFNNLLQAVVGNIGLAMLQGPEQPEPWLQMADSAAMRGAELVRQLMLYARGEVGVFDPHPLDLREVIERAVSLCRKTIDRRLALQVDITPDLPVVEGDGGQLEQVLLNLYLNARDALSGVERPQQWIRTVVRVVDRAAPTDPSVRPYVQVEVRDNGTGMDVQTLGRLFEPFFTTKEVGKGTGLGLSTSYGILQRHGGWIECESQLGVGTSFRLYLPVAETSAAAVTVLEAAEAAELRRGAETILVVDDEELVRRATTELLATLGYHVLEAEDGQQALEVVAQHREQVGLVLLDLSMPKVSGVEVLRRLRAEEPQLKVILCTGHSTDRAQPDGVTEMLEKPFALSKLARVVRHALDGIPHR
ncbi:MAG: response regulator [Candidatus Latescibacteria bacterium]|nr:response regulator [Candidatus Latescibacterota bacterium]